ncbi:MAG TPA: hypothetical protein VF546_23715 [Pyrinomonadaceae bacterium]|jgi:hypothetical protein
MANDNQTKSTTEPAGDPDLRPDSTPNPVEEVNPANDRRSVDYGESGQYAPGGRYGELEANKNDRIDLDEQFPDKSGNK